MPWNWLQNGHLNIAHTKRCNSNLLFLNSMWLLSRTAVLVSVPSFKFIPKMFLCLIPPPRVNARMNDIFTINKHSLYFSNDFKCKCVFLCIFYVCLKKLLQNEQQNISCSSALKLHQQIKYSTKNWMAYARMRIHSHWVSTVMFTNGGAWCALCTVNKELYAYPSLFSLFDSYCYSFIHLALATPSSW